MGFGLTAATESLIAHGANGERFLGFDSPLAQPLTDAGSEQKTGGILPIQVEGGTTLLHHAVGRVLMPHTRR